MKVVSETEALNDCFFAIENSWNKSHSAIDDKDKLIAIIGAHFNRLSNLLSNIEDDKLEGFVNIFTSALLKSCRRPDKEVDIPE